MQNRHADRRRYFEEQGRTTQRHVMPFIAPFLPLHAGLSVLEVGCGEGGNLTPFADLGCSCVGIDLNEKQIARAREFFDGHPHQSQLRFIYQDIYAADVDDLGRFDLIIMRDVIEHIIDQERFMGYIHRFLKPGGRLFIGFPPWQMPFGGHQQICENRWLSKLPWFHLLPTPLYRAILRMAGESGATIQELLDIKQTGISIERLRRVMARAGWRALREQLYLVNPNYETKFGLQPRTLPAGLGAIPGLRNFYTTCVYLVLEHPDAQ